MKKQIVIINGTGGSGKDTFVDFCSKYCEIFNFSTISKIKEIAKAMGWSGEKTEKDRKFLSDLKLLATQYNDMPYNETKKAIDNFKKSNALIMFIHVREPKEIAKIVSEFKAITLLIKRNNYELITSNSSDANVENYNYDYVIVNDTLESLKKYAKEFVDKIVH